jgi:hypothetical protein
MEDHGGGLGGAGFARAEDYPATALGNNPCIREPVSVVHECDRLAWPWLPCFIHGFEGCAVEGPQRCQCRRTYTLLDGGLALLFQPGPLWKGRIMKYEDDQHSRSIILQRN